MQQRRGIQNLPSTTMIQPHVTRPDSFEYTMTMYKRLQKCLHEPENALEASHRHKVMVQADYSNEAEAGSQIWLEQPSCHLYRHKLVEAQKKSFVWDRKNLSGKTNKTKGFRLCMHEPIA